MKLLGLKEKVLKRIDEASSEVSEIAARFNIEEFLEEATVELLKTAPLSALRNITSITSAPVSLGDGSGYVELPSDFLRLAEFRMKGWRRSVFIPLLLNSKEYNRQFNPYTRGGIGKPKVAIVPHGQVTRLLYWSLLPDTIHEAEIASYVPICSPENLSDELLDALCWLTATLVLAVCNNPQGSDVARSRYNQIFNML